LINAHGEAGALSGAPAHDPLPIKARAVEVKA
jgi:hypothetical protein